jgi:hypothetical protein
VLPGPYDQHAAERYAREALIPAEEFLPVAGESTKSTMPPGSWRR